MNETSSEAEKLEVPNNNPKKSMVTRLLALSILLIVALCAVGYSVYAWQQNQSLSSNATNQENTIKELQQQLSQANAKGVPTVSGNVIPIRELGVSITVADSIKDLTYSYSIFTSGSKKTETVDFSTKNIINKYAANNECTSFGTAPPLGRLSRVPGQYSKGSEVMDGPGLLAKQFDSFYIAYVSPQSACAESQTEVPAELEEFKKALPTLKELN